MVLTSLIINALDRSPFRSILSRLFLFYFDSNENSPFEYNNKHLILRQQNILIITRSYFIVNIVNYLIHNVLKTKESGNRTKKKTEICSSLSFIYENKHHFEETFIFFHHFYTLLYHVHGEPYVPGHQMLTFSSFHIFRHICKMTLKLISY